MSQNNIIVFDSKVVQQHRERSKKIGADHQFLIDHCRKNLGDRLQDIKRDFLNSVDLENKSDDYAALNIKPQSTDLIKSHLDLHWINDLPGWLLQIRQALKPDGVFLASMFGGETLYQLRETLMQTELEMFGGVSPRVSPFADMRDMGALLQRAGFSLPVVDHEMIHVTYEHLFNLIADLRGMGQTNAVLNRSKKYLGKEFWARANDYYLNNFSNDKGRLVATFEVVYLIGWSPDETQQQPLKPGSAKHSLAQVLKTSEISLPEKAQPKK